MEWFKDAVERLVKTFLQAFLATITASGLGLVEIIEDTSILERAAVAGLAAVYSLVFSFLSKYANGGGGNGGNGGGGGGISPASLVPPSS